MQAFHLAQVNIGRIRAPLTDPAMRGFVDLLDPINALAERSPGFVWRLAGSDLTMGDPLLIVNLSVWESVDSLREFAYKSGHLAPLRARSVWFEKLDRSYLALWWVPAGHRPTIAEAEERLLWRDARGGDTPFAFSFSQPFAPPAAEFGAAVEPAFSIDGRVFREERSSMVFRYFQEGPRVWAMYEGGGVRFGTLSGVATAPDRFESVYCQADAENQFRSGRCWTKPVLTDSGWELRETWHWTAGAEGEGSSLVRELVR